MSDKNGRLSLNELKLMIMLIILILSIFYTLLQVSLLIDFVSAYTCLAVEATVEYPFIFAATYV